MKHIAEKHKETETQDSEPISSNLSFQRDQCDFTGASDKGLKQHTRMKHRISQVNGNDSDSDDCSELIERNCYNVLARTVKCVVSCNKIFTTKKSVINTCTSVQANAAKSSIQI